MIQPPRGFGENPVAIYHDPDLPPSHHYLAAYRWLAEDFRADAVDHLASTAPWSGCPARGSACPRGARRTRCSRDLPLVYPFIVNDPGEGTQAKRRGQRRPPSTTWSRRWPAPSSPPAGWPSSSSCWTSTPPSPRSTRTSCRAVRAQIWSLVARRPACTTTSRRSGRAAGRRPSSTASCCTSTATCARSRTPRSATACTSSAPPRPGRRAGQPGPGHPARAPAVERPLGQPWRRPARRPRPRRRRSHPIRTPHPAAPLAPSDPSAVSAPSAPSVRVETDRYERIAREVIEAIAATNWDATRAQKWPPASSPPRPPSTPPMRLSCPTPCRSSRGHFRPPRHSRPSIKILRQFWLL